MSGSFDRSEVFDRNWVGPVELRPRSYRTQMEKDIWYGCVVENEYRLKDLKPDDVIIDIGAHIGSFSYLAYLKGSRSVYAFEIDPWHVEAGIENIKGKEDGIAYYHCAIVRGDEQRQAQYRYGGNWNSWGAVGVPVESRSLDEVISQVLEPGQTVRFMKLDCEGGEWPALYTCKQLDRVEEIAGEYHLMDAGPKELQNLKYPISLDGLHACLKDAGFDYIEIVELATCTGNFFARRTSLQGASKPSLATVTSTFTPYLRPVSADESFWKGSYEQNSFGCPDLQPHDLVIDLGSAIGSFTRLAWEKGSRNIIACEIDPEAYTVGLRNVCHLDGVDMRHVAVVGSLPPDYVLYSIGSSSLWSSGDDQILVKATSFDELIGPRRVRFVKMNIEGSEWSILYNSTRLHQIREISGQLHEPGPPDFPGVRHYDDYTIRKAQAILEGRGFRVHISSPDPGHRIFNFHAIRD